MTVRVLLLALLAMAGSTASTASRAADGAGDPSRATRVPLRDARGALLGVARVVPAGRKLELQLIGMALAPGAHGLHLHAVGRCDGPGFQSAGAHWNPHGKAHGHGNPAGPHRGDLGNVTVDADGTFKVGRVIDPEIDDRDGTALVIHALPDDNRTDPSGGSGDRIACAVLAAPR